MPPVVASTTAKSVATTTAQGCAGPRAGEGVCKRVRGVDVACGLAKAARATKGGRGDCLRTADIGDTVELAWRSEWIIGCGMWLSMSEFRLWDMRDMSVHPSANQHELLSLLRASLRDAIHGTLRVRLATWRRARVCV
eukprot:2737468-Prymnesium_polylepis.1